MGEKSWKQIKDEVRESLWPFPTEAKTQIAVHDKYLLEGVMDLQKWVTCLQARNTSQIPFCATYFQCGKTVVDAPNFGVIQRIYTIANGKWCDEVFYRSTNFNRIECWSKRYLTFTQPDNAGLQVLPMGFKFAEATSDNDCGGGRARSGLWAINRGRLYVAPWIQSNETLIVEWDGMKPDWKDTDMVDDTLWTPRVLAALRDYVWWKHCQRFGNDPTEKEMAHRAYADALSDLMHDCHEATREQRAQECGECEQPVLSAAELDDDKVSTDETPYVMAVVGDHGDNNATRDAVAALVDSWNPSKLLYLGDNWYGSSLDVADLIARQGPIYERFNDAGNLIPLVGNHDRDPVGRLAVEMAHFTFPPIKTELGDVPSTGYFTTVPDPRVEVFSFDSGYDNSQVNQQADGVALNSKQSNWLRIAAARSVAKFLVLRMHHPAYTSFRSTSTGPTLSSDGFLAYPELRQPFKTWGFDLVLFGHIHSFEHLEVDGLPYVNIGASGHELRQFDPNNLSPYSKFYYDAEPGAGRVSVTCKKLTLEYFTASGLQHTLEIEK